MADPMASRRCHIYFKTAFIFYHPISASNDSSVCGDMTLFEFPLRETWGKMKVYCCRVLYNIYLWILMLSIPAFSGNCIQMFSVYQYLFYLYIFFYPVNSRSVFMCNGFQITVLFTWMEEKNKLMNWTQFVLVYHFLFMSNENVLHDFWFY